MLHARILIVHEESPQLNALVQKLETQGAEVFTTGTGAGGLLLLGRVCPDVLVLDPLAGRGRPEDWRRGLERYRSTRPLAVWAVARTSRPGSWEDEADLGAGDLRDCADLLGRLESEFGSGEFRQYAA